MSTEIAPFRLEIDSATIEDLRRRLRATRWPDAETTAGSWDQRTPLAYAQSVCRHWADEYDMQRLATRLNAWPQFRSEVQGLGIHFIHARSPHATARPIVLRHGWPGSVVEFLKVLGPLTHPLAHGGNAADAFHVVCPSLPG